MTDPFSILGVTRDATDDQIKSSYRKLAMQYHPDRNPGDKAAEERFKEISAAYETLKDPIKRQFAQGQAQHGQRQRAPGGFEFSFDGHNFQFEDIFSAFGHGRPHRNNDLQTSYAITLEQAFHGAEIDLELRTRVGVRYARVTVPAGIDSGVRLRVQGEGERVYGNLPPGDLYVIIEVRPHQSYRRIQQNLTTHATIDAFDAMTGTTIDVMSLDGKTITVTVPAGVQVGQRLRVPGFGMPVLGTDVRGDLLVVVEVRIPANLSEDQIEQLRRIKNP